MENALDRLAGLADVEGPVTLDVFARTLELELEADLGRVGRIGDGVLVGSVRMGVGLDLDLVILLGLVEGSFPAPVRDDSLLPDDERQAASGELWLRADETERQHHELLATLAGAGAAPAVRPPGRSASEQRTGRLALGDRHRRRAGGRRIVAEDLLTADDHWVEHVASFDAGLRGSASRRPRRSTGSAPSSRSVAASGPPAPDGDETDPVLTAGAACWRRGAAARFTRFDGNLAGLAVPSPAGAITSATRLEGWAVCPFAYFVQEVLRVEPVENPEDRLQISPLDLG